MALWPVVLNRPLSKHDAFKERKADYAAFPDVYWRFFRQGSFFCQSPAMMLPNGITSSTTSARP